MTTPTDLTNEVKALGDATIARLLDSDGHWIADLDHADVWGWQLSTQGGDHVALVYYRADKDFEIDDAVVDGAVR